MKASGAGRHPPGCSIIDLLVADGDDSYSPAICLDRVEATGLCLFNDAILREAFRVGVPVLDLRLVCTEAADYARSSPIEPSVVGGGKIARAISRLVTGNDFQGEGSRVFA